MSSISQNSSKSAVPLFETAVLFLPFLVMFVINQWVLGLSYADGPTAYTLHYWLAHGTLWKYAIIDIPCLHKCASAHYPGIPQSEFVGFLLTALKLPLSLPLFAKIGVALNLVLYFLACVWTARLARAMRLSIPPLALAALLIVQQPGMMLEWSPYPHYTVLLLPLGAAIYGLTVNPDMARNYSRWPLFWMGFALTMTYSAAILCAALLIALAAVSVSNRYGSLTRTFSSIRHHTVFNGIVVGLGIIFLISVFIAYYKLLGDLAGVLRGAPLITAIGLFLLTLLWLSATWLLPRFGIGRFFIHVGGYWLIGWAAGANIYLIHSWANGLANAPISDGTVAVIEVIKSIYSVFWMMLIPVSVLCPVAMIFQCRSARNNGALLLAGFLVSIATLNMAITSLWPNGRDFSSYLDARYFASLAIAVPIVLLWAYNAGSAVRAIAAAIAITITAGAGYQYIHLTAQQIAQDKPSYTAANQITAYLKAEKPGAARTCVTLLDGECGEIFTYDLFINYYEADIRNKAPFPFFDGEIKSALAVRHCQTMSCLRDAYGLGRDLYIIHIDGALSSAVMNMTAPVQLPFTVKAPVSVRVLPID